MDEIFKKTKNNPRQAKVENGKAEVENTKTGEKEIMVISKIKEKLLK